MHIRSYFLALGLTFFPLYAAPVINEFLANPSRGDRADEDGDREDWIEIFNPDATAVNLAGYSLTDDPAGPDRWVFPAGTTLGAGEYLLVVASNKNRTDPSGELHTDFRLSSEADSVALFEPGNATAISQFDWTLASAQRSGVSTGLLSGEIELLASPTPEGVNTGPIFSRARVIFAEDSRTFVDSLEVALSSDVAGSEIRYTLDGSFPGETSTLYTTPISLAESTNIRARVTSGGLGEVSGRQYIRLSTSAISDRFDAGAATLPEFTSNLPIVVLENFDGLGANQTVLRNTTVSVFEPVNGITTLQSTPVVSTRAGIRIRGASSAGFAKKQYRIETRNQEDFDKDVSFLGLPSDSDWVFGAPFVDKSLIRNSFVFDLGRDIDSDAPRTRHVELFINENGSDLDYRGDYKGVYLITEQLRISNDRVDIERLGLLDNAEPEVTGGYLMSFEEGISQTANLVPGFTTLEIRDPDPQTQITSEQRAWLGGYMQAADAALMSPNFKDPVDGYAKFFDLPAYHNLFVINELTRDQDAYTRSNYLYKDRGGKLVQGPLWDYNLTFGTGGFRNNANATPSGGGDNGWQYSQNNAVSAVNWEVRLLQDEDFEQGFIDRWHELRAEGPLADASFSERADKEAIPLSSGAAIRNFAIWNSNLRVRSLLNDQNFSFFQTPLTASWEAQVDFMKSWSAERMRWVDSQFLSAPVLTPLGREAIAGDRAFLRGQEGTIYYTIDGRDPRLPDGGIVDPVFSYTTMPATDVALIPEDSPVWNYLDDGSDQGDSDVVVGRSGYNALNWKHPDFDDSAWLTGEAPLGYSNSVTTEISFGEDTSNRHVTSYFRHEFEVSDPESLTEIFYGIQYDDGAIIYLNGVEIRRVNIPYGTVGFDTFTPDRRNTANERKWEDFKLDPRSLRAGRNVIAVEVHQASLRDTDHSLNFRLNAKQLAMEGAEIPLNSSLMITARAFDGTNWSGKESQIVVVGDAGQAHSLVISEINYHPVDPTPAEIQEGYTDADDFEFIELLNTGLTPIDLSGVSFTRGVDFTFDVGTVLAGGERIVIARNEAALRFRYPELGSEQIVGPFANGTGLSNSSDRLTLRNFQGEKIQTVRYRDEAPWPTAADGEGVSLVLLLPFTSPDHELASNWQASSDANGNPATQDGTPFAGGSNEELLSYATGGVLPTIAREAGEPILFTVGLNPTADDLTGRVETSTDLINWTPAGSEFQNVGLTVDGESAAVTFQSLSSNLPERTFVRYLVSE